MTDVLEASRSPKFAIGEYGFNRAQAAFWSRLSLVPEIDHENGVCSRFSTTPVYPEVLSEHLHFPYGKGELEHMASRPDMPRLAAILHLGRRAIGQAIIVPTCAEGGLFGCGPVPVQRLGYKIGKIGVFVKEDHRGRGYGRALLEALEVRISAARTKQKMCLISAGRLLPLARSIFDVPVIAGDFRERTPFEKPGQIY